MTRPFVVALAVAAMLVALAATAERQRPDVATQTSFTMLFADTTRQTDSVGTTPELAIPDLSPARALSVQRLKICNGGTGRLCVSWLAAGGTCSSSGVTCDASATDGEWIAAGSCWAPKVSGALSTCVVAELASTPYQVSRSAP